MKQSTGLIAALAFATALSSACIDDKVNEENAKMAGLHVSIEEDVTLSNGTKIPHSRIISTAKSPKMTMYIVDAELGELYIFDEGDSKPYLYQETGWKKYNKGKLTEDHSYFVKRFDFTYTYGGTEYPIWEPTAFRQNPKYIEFGKQLSQSHVSTEPSKSKTK